MMIEDEMQKCLRMHFYNKKDLDPKLRKSDDGENDEISKLLLLKFIIQLFNSNNCVKNYF